MNKENAAGVLIFVGAFVFSISILIGEALRPTYSVSLDVISGLGAGQNAYIFNDSIILMGVLLIISGILLITDGKKYPWIYTLIIVGIGAIGVGIFHVNTGFKPHSISATIAFVFSGISAILFATTKGTPLRYLSAAVGVLILVSFLLFRQRELLGLGVGGMERMIVYPTLLWAMAVSGYMLGKKEIPASVEEA